MTNSKNVSPKKSDAVKKVKKMEKVELDKMVDEVVSESNDGMLGLGGEYLELGIEKTIYPRDRYDFVVFVPESSPGYLLGTATARAYSALKDGGIFVIDFSGMVYNPEEIKNQILFSSFVFEKEEKGKMFFRK